MLGALLGSRNLKDGKTVFAFNELTAYPALLNPYHSLP